MIFFWVVQTFEDMMNPTLFIEGLYRKQFRISALSAALVERFEPIYVPF